MHKTADEAKQFVKDLIKNLPLQLNCETLVCPPFTALAAVAKEIAGSPVKLGAQNMHFELKGAFTGEISVEFIKNLGCEYVILGHSERRQYFQETDATVNKKTKTALQAELKPIVCVGEKLPERESDLTFNVIKKQLEGGFDNIMSIENIMIAYEPVWAIGTGKTATPEQAEAVHLYIRNFMSDKFGKSAAEHLRILYGGSVTPENISTLMKQNDIDGALVGGASLKVESFAQLINLTLKSLDNIEEK